MRRRLSRWTFAAALAGATLALLVSASAQDVTRAHLLTVPDATALSDHFPPVALATGVSGRVVLSCAIALDGSSECSAAEETPANAGFGAAAVALAQDWRFSPRIEGGHPVTSVSRVPIEFQNPSSEALVIEPDLPVDQVRSAQRLEDGASVTRGFDPSRSVAADIEPIIITGYSSSASTRPPSSDDASRPNPPVDTNARFYPERARASNIDGRALVACVVRSDHRIACESERENPEGWEFGQRAVALVSEATNASSMASGAAFRVPVDFALHDDGSAPAVRSSYFYIERPRQRTFMTLYPPAAVQRNVSGEVILICAIRADLKFDCAMREEAPAGYGFGAGALRLTDSFRLTESKLGSPGLNVGDRVQFPIIFRTSPAPR